MEYEIRGCFVVDPACLLFKSLCIESFDSNSEFKGESLSLRTVVYPFFIDYIVNSNRILTNSEIAAHFNISKRSAEILFKSHYNATIHKFSLDYKLSESKKYLVDYPDMKIISIAKTLGFYDEFHFSKRFTREFGISPSVYRKQNQISIDEVAHSSQ